jgi:galactokinase
VIFTIVIDLKTRLLNSFDTHFGGVPDVMARAPGRVNLIGEHTDYNDGFVLPMAIGCETMVAARRRQDSMIHLRAADFGAQAQFSIAAPIMPCADAPWSNYVRGVAHALQSDGLALCGADIAISGTIPKGAGLSSSASLEVATGLALAALAGAPDYDRTQLALAGQRAEHEFAGCKCGIMDQLVSAHGKAGHAVLIDCRSLATKTIPMPDDITVMIIDSGISRGLVDGHYNARRQQCEQVARHFNVKALRDIDMARLEEARAALDPLVYVRARHVVSENARTLTAAEALAAGNLNILGKLMAESHKSMRDDFAITLPAIDQLVALLQEAIGPMGGARMTGGGFGGAVVAILPRAQEKYVTEAVHKNYRTPSGTLPLIMRETASNGVSFVPL